MTSKEEKEFLETPEAKEGEIVVRLNFGKKGKPHRFTGSCDLPLAKFPPVASLMPPMVAANAAGLKPVAVAKKVHDNEGGLRVCWKMAKAINGVVRPDHPFTRFGLSNCPALAQGFITIDTARRAKGKNYDTLVVCLKDAIDFDELHKGCDFSYPEGLRWEVGGGEVYGFTEGEDNDGQEIVFIYLER